MASAFLAFTSLNMRTASPGEECTADKTARGEYALKHQVGSARERIQKVLSGELRYAPNGQQRNVDTSKTFPHLGERRANGNLVLVFPVMYGTVRSIASKIHILM
jgi:hypothetical protein